MAQITMLIPSLKGGGAERTALRVAGGLAGRGHHVDIVLFTPTVAYPKELPRSVRLIVLCGRNEWAKRARADIPEGAIWRLERSPPARLVGLVAGLVRDFRAGASLLLRRTALGRALRLAPYMERERPDIVFANLPPAEYAAFFAARLVSSAPPIVPIMHTVAVPDTTRAMRRQLLFPAAAHVVTVSRGVAENAIAVIGVPKGWITTIYNPAFTEDIARHAEAAPDHHWFHDGGPPVVLGVGRLVPQKDFPTLIEAFRQVQAYYPCRLLILGEGPRRAELEGRIQALGLEDHVSLPGWTENPYAFMSRAELFVLTSRQEGFGNVLVEALACGCPTVATDCPSGPSEILEDSDLLASVGDPEALATVMLRALARPVDKAALCARAARFSVERAVDGYDNLVTALLAHNRENGGG